MLIAIMHKTLAVMTVCMHVSLLSHLSHQFLLLNCAALANLPQYAPTEQFIRKSLIAEVENFPLHFDMTIRLGVVMVWEVIVM